MTRLVGTGGDEKLANDLIDLLTAAEGRGVEAIMILVTVAATMGSLIGVNVSELKEADRLAEAVANGVKASTRQAFSDKLDRRS